MAADHGMFSPSSWQSLAGASFLNLPEYCGETSISAVADQMIRQTLIADSGTLNGPPLYP